LLFRILAYNIERAIRNALLILKYYLGILQSRIVDTHVLCIL
jgi:hypothetical protein